MRVEMILRNCLEEKVDTVKYVRLAFTELGLKESKEFVELNVDNNGDIVYDKEKNFSKNCIRIIKEQTAKHIMRTRAEKLVLHFDEEEVPKLETDIKTILRLKNNGNKLDLRELVQVVK